MTRKQILKEALSKQELDWLEANEDKTRAFVISNNPEDPRHGKLQQYSQDLVGNKVAANTVDNPKAKVAKLSKITNKAQDILEKVLAKQITGDDLSVVDTIIGELTNNEKKVDISKCSNGYFSLNATSFSDATKTFLKDLYKEAFSTGSNAIGAGELCFTYIFKNAKFLDHTSKNNKADLIIGDKKVEIKATGGRLDGSGVRPQRIEVKPLQSIIRKAIIATANYEDKNARPITLAFKKACKSFFTDTYNFFSREHIEKDWFELYEFFKQNDTLEDGTKLDIVDLFTSTSGIFAELYRAVYGNSEDYTEALEDFYKEYYDKLFDSLIKKNVDQFVITDTEIRARIYLYSTLGNEGAVAGDSYLLFCKYTGDDVIAYILNYEDFSDNDVDRYWEDLYKRQKIKITPSNDSKRPAPAIRLGNTKTVQDNEELAKVSESVLKEHKEYIFPEKFGGWCGFDVPRETPWVLYTQNLKTGEIIPIAAYATREEALAEKPEDTYEGEYNIDNAFEAENEPDVD